MSSSTSKPRLQEYYTNTVVPALKKEFNYKNVMEIPRITKVVVNIGEGKASQDRKLVQFAQENLEAITGQKSLVTKVRRSNAAFKIRDGWPIGCKVTLRRERMFEFLDRLVAIALPRTRDFRGISPKGFDRRGNYNLGIKEQIVFPEIDYDKIDTIRGLNITINTTAKTDEEALALLKLFKFPFKETSK